MNKIDRDEAIQIVKYYIEGQHVQTDVLKEALEIVVKFASLGEEKK